MNTRRRKFSSHLVATFIVASLNLSVSAQQPAPNPDTYFKVGVVERKATSVRVVANDPRPLEQALCAVIRQYNWLVDYEDPPYVNDTELIDVSSPKWRASHPNVKRMKIPAGGAFEFRYEEGSAIDSPEGEEGLLRKLVSAYNSSGNPGKFIVRDAGEDPRPWSNSHKRFTIVGASVKGHDGSEMDVASILDTQISIPTAERSAHETIGLILEELSRNSGTRVHPPGWASNRLIQSRVTVGGTNVPARTLLLQTLRATSNPSFVWKLLYDANAPMYVLNIGVVNSFCR